MPWRLSCDAGDQADDLGHVDEAVLAAHRQRGHAAGLDARRRRPQHRAGWPPRSSPVPCSAASSRAATLTVSPIGVVFLVLDVPSRQIVDFAGVQAHADGERRQAALARSARSSQARNSCVASAMPSAAETARRAAGSGEPPSWCPKTRHQAVADELEVPAAVVQHRFADALEVLGRAARPLRPEPSFSASEVKLRMSENSTVACEHLVGHRARSAPPARTCRAACGRPGFRVNARRRCVLARRHGRLDGLAAIRAFFFSSACRASSSSTRVNGLAR